MSAQDIYASLWEKMERDFEEQLDAPTFNAFESNVSKWANIHSSEATQEVGIAIWNALHAPNIVQAKGIKGHYRDRFTGLFRTKVDYEAQAEK